MRSEILAKESNPETRSPKKSERTPERGYEILKEVAEVRVRRRSRRRSPKRFQKNSQNRLRRRFRRRSPRRFPRRFRRRFRRKIPKEVTKEVPKEVTAVTLHPGEKLTIKTKEEKELPSPPPLLAREEEVKQFFANYIDRYNRKDTGGFLSFFSSKAIQNQKDGLEGIRNIYTKFFNQSQEVRYQIEGMKIEIYQNRVDVKARFRVNQKLKKGAEEKIWKGSVRWVLVEENGNLKITSLDYQNEKSP